MKHIICIATAVLLISCGHSALVSPLEGSDSVSVQFTQPGTGSPVKVVESNNDYALQDLLRFADGEQTEQFSCGHDGYIIFYKKGIQTGDIAFNYTTKDCQHFLHRVNGKITTTKMSYEAIDFLKALAVETK
jgi:hypothetical protein